MAEKKISDLVFLLIFGIFFLGVFLALFSNFDDQYNPPVKISQDLNSSYRVTSTDYKATEISVHQDTFNTSSVTIVPGTDVDPRGTSQTVQLARKSPSIVQSFFDDISKKIQIHPYIIGFVMFLIIVSGIIVILRFFRPGGA